MSDAGYVRLHRSILGNPAFRTDGEAMAFAWMVARAAWQPVRVRYRGRPVALNRGQLAVSIRDISAHIEREKGWVERLLSRLKAEGMIATTAETGVSVITICNYDKYQAPLDAGRTPGETGDGTTKGTPAGQRQDTEQRREKGKKEKGEGGALARVVSAWNEMAGPAKLPKVDTVTDARAKSIKARLDEHGEAAILRAFAAVPASAFLMGRTGGGRQWRANLDDLIRPANMAKLISGGYHTEVEMRAARRRVEAPPPPPPVTGTPDVARATPEPPTAEQAKAAAAAERADFEARMRVEFGDDWEQFTP